MYGLAKISVESGVVFLPVETPYDQDVLFEYLGATAAAHRQVEVELAQLRLSVCESDGAEACVGCTRVMSHAALRCVVGGRTFCGRCARLLVRSAEDDAPPPAEGGGGPA